MRNVRTVFTRRKIDRSVTSIFRRSEGALARGNAAQTQFHLNLRHCLATPKQLLSYVFHPVLTHTTGRPPREPRKIALAQSPPRRPPKWTADQRGDRGGLRHPPLLVSTRSYVRCAGRMLRIPRVGVALGAGARCASAPRPSRRWRRGRACAAAATRQDRGAGAHTCGASVQGMDWGAPDREPLPHWLTGRPPRTRRRCHAGRGGGRHCGAGDHLGGRHRPPRRARIRAALTGGTRGRGREPAAAGGRVGRAPFPAGPHAVGGWGRSQRRRCRAWSDGAPPRASVGMPPAGRPHGGRA